MKTLFSAAMSGSSADPHDSAPLPISGMSFSHSASVDGAECPKCGKRSIVERSSGVFDCLNCSFHRELPPVARRAKSGRSSESSLSSPQEGRQRRGTAQRTLLSPAKSLDRRQVTSTLPHHLSVSQRGKISTLLSSEAHHSAVDRFPFDLNEDMAEPDQSQPWIFAVIAVIFGILLL